MYNGPLLPSLSYVFRGKGPWRGPFWSNQLCIHTEIMWRAESEVWNDTKQSPALSRWLLPHARNLLHFSSEVVYGSLWLGQNISMHLTTLDYPFVSRSKLWTTNPSFFEVLLTSNSQYILVFEVQSWGQNLIRYRVEHYACHMETHCKGFPKNLLVYSPLFITIIVTYM